MLTRSVPPMSARGCRQSGASLIEVLIAVLLLSFGMLAMGGMMSVAVQQPKLASYRASATMIAVNHIERIRANAVGFNDGSYDLANAGSYNASHDVTNLSDCAYPTCNTTQLATMDTAYTNRQLRQQLPAGGMVLTRNGTMGHLWIMWLEASSSVSLDVTGSDNCPPAILANFTTDRPRCLYFPFQM